MTTRLNIHMSPDGVELADSAAPDAVLFRFSLDPDTLPARMEELRAKADELAPEGWETVLILPDDQILYTRITLADGPDQHALVQEGLVGLTPYAVTDLHFDWERADEFSVQVAAVAQETLAEAEEFALAYGLNPVGFAATPAQSRFPRSPWFGPTKQALETPADLSLEKDLIPVEADLDPSPDAPDEITEPPFTTEENLEPISAIEAEEPNESQESGDDAPLQTAAPDTPEDLVEASPSPAPFKVADFPTVPVPEGDAATRPASLPTAKQDLRQIGIAVAALFVLSVGFWLYLSLGNQSPEPENFAEFSQPVEAPAPTAPVDLPQPLVTTTVTGPEAKNQPTPRDEVLPNSDSLQTPPLHAAPPIPEPSESHAAPRALDITPPKPSQEAVVQSDPQPELAQTEAGTDTADGEPLITAPSPDTLLAPEEETTSELSVETAELELTPEELAELEEDLETFDRATVEEEDTLPEETEEEVFNIVVIEGAPENAPKIRPIPAEVLENIANYRPLARPDTILPRPELRVVVATEETPGYRPTERPAALSVPRPNVIIAANPPIRPTLRPRSQSASINDAVRAATAPSSGGNSSAAPSANPGIPTSASIADRATDENELRLRQINLIGVFGTRSERRALVRLSSGRILRLKVGDRLDGGKVSAITDEALTYVKRGKNVVLKMPKG